MEDEPIMRAEGMTDLNAEPMPERVLILDDDSDTRAYIASILVPHFEVLEHGDPETVEDAIQAFSPTVILLDYYMPIRDGFAVVRALRRRPEYDMISLVMVSGVNTEAARLEAYAAGADDFIAKPFDEKELRVKVEIWIRIANRANVLLDRSRRFREMACRDVLTGLASRRYILELLDREMRRFSRYGEPFSVLLADLDDFKWINDEFGHKAGDEALKAVATALRTSLRDVDVAARYGGDEFLILLPNTNRSQAEAVCRKLTAKPIPVELRDGEIEPLCLSIGGVQAEEANQRISELIDEADMAMLTAKKSGKGGFFVAGEDVKSLDILDELRNRRNSTREVVCQMMGYFFEELYRTSDVFIGHAHLSLEVAHALCRAYGYSIREWRTVRNAIRILPCLYVGMPEEAQAFMEGDSPSWRSVYADVLRRNIQRIRYGRVFDAEAAILEQVGEYVDGSGLPEGLEGEAVSRLSQIVALAWECSEMRRHAQPGAKLTAQTILNRLRSQAGTRFHPELIEMLSRVTTKQPDLLFPPPGGYLLLIDDNRDFAEALRQLLAWDGYEVVLAGSLQEVYSCAHDHEWVAVLLDLRLGNEDGFHVYEQMCEYIHAEPPAVVVSAEASPSVVERARLHGFYAFARKPVQVEELTRVLQAIHKKVKIPFEVIS